MPVEPVKFNRYTWVEKYTGEARWMGRIVAAYYTTRNKLRYVVEVWPQGFQMIATGEQLRACDPPKTYVKYTSESNERRMKAETGAEKLKDSEFVVITKEMAKRLFDDETKTLVWMRPIDPTDYEWPMDAPQHKVVIKSELDQDWYRPEPESEPKSKLTVEPKWFTYKYGILCNEDGTAAKGYLHLAEAGAYKELEQLLKTTADDYQEFVKQHNKEVRSLQNKIDDLEDELRIARG